MATIYTKSRRHFILGSMQLLAILEFKINTKSKLTSYDFPFREGIQYEDNGEEEVSISLNGLLLDFSDDNKRALTQIDQLRREFNNQKKYESIKFAHPEIGAFNVKIKEYSIQQKGENEGYSFNIELLKNTIQREIERTQLSSEKQFESLTKQSEGQFKVVSGDSLFAKAKEIYGDGLLWRKIWDYSSNKSKSKSKDPALIYVGEIYKYPIFK